MPEAISTVPGPGYYTYDEDGVGRCEGAPGTSATPAAVSADDAATCDASEPGVAKLVEGRLEAEEELDCLLKVGKAGVVCAGAIVVGAPTLVGSFLAGAACGLEFMDAYLCYERE